MLFQIAAHTVWSKAILAGTTHQSSKGKRAWKPDYIVSATHRNPPKKPEISKYKPESSPHKIGNNNEKGIHGGKTQQALI